MPVDPDCAIVGLMTGKEVDCFRDFKAARRWAYVFTGVFAALPIAWLLSFWLFIFKWWEFHGALPGTTKYIAAPLRLYESVSAFLLMCGAYSFPLWAAILIYLYKFIIPRRDIMWWVLVFVPWAVAIAWAKINPGGFFWWFID